MHKLKKIPYTLGRAGLLNWMNDEAYLSLIYYFRMGYRLNLNNPQTFNEKIMWLKIHDHNAEYTKMVDKYEMKKYVSAIVGKQYVIPMLGVWNTFDDIDFDKLPDAFVLKCTHDSGGVVICKSKKDFNKLTARKKIENCLNHNYFWSSREWPYRDIEPRIIAEKYMTDLNKNELSDYKLMMFNGILRCSFVCNNRYSKQGLNVTFFDTDWNMMPFERYYPRSRDPISKPYSYGKMVEIARILSKSIPFVRIDFYEINKEPFIGEITFYPGGGVEKFEPSRYDRLLGEWIDLSDIISKDV